MSELHPLLQELKKLLDEAEWTEKGKDYINVANFLLDNWDDLVIAMHEKVHVSSVHGDVNLTIIGAIKK